MTDCPNTEMRDRLPDLLHEHLDVSARAAVLAHVQRCADCTGELALLRQMRVLLSSDIVAVDSAMIARAVIARTATLSARSVRRSRWTEWRLAAAIVVIAAGGAALATVYARRAPNDEPTVPVAAVSPALSPSGVRVGGTTPVVSPPAPTTGAAVPPSRGPELAAAGDASDLSESALRALLNDLDTMEALPPTEPEPVNMRVSLPERGGSE